ncbi:hypothetical protein RHMOL_Rhmol02G0017400 [Rhododendron molle]|uniref:Uncharacterized protein n=1 Tax=Rhododendron molle TaxID=49168 RepID=A0ACC0PKC0_RHOML|nr:hypothetical protein RHMOL_Rhmol02G0017400 [Rhododendron molle]
MDPKANPNAISPPPPPTVPSPPLAQPPLHQSDADEEDDSVKQLNECSSVYLSLQGQQPPSPCSIWEGYLVNDGRGSCLCGTFSFGDGPYFLAEVQALKACNEKRNNDKRK